MKTTDISDMLHRAMLEAGLDGHVRMIENIRQAYTWAERVAWRFSNHKLLVKNSYMFCDTLDMCFFYDTNMKATFAYAGYSAIGRADIMQDKLLKAFQKAKEVLIIMDRIANEEDIEEKRLRDKDE